MSIQRIRRIICCQLLLIAPLFSCAEAADTASDAVKLTLPVLSLRPLSPPSATAVQSAPVIGILVTIDGKASPISLSIIADTYIVKDRDQSNGTAELLILQSSRTQTLLKADLSPLKGVDAASIKDAELAMNIGWMQKPGSTSISVYQMHTPWTEDATWSQPLAGATWEGARAKVDFDAVPLGKLDLPKTPTGAILIPGLASAVRSWISDPSTNQGLLVRYEGSSQQINLLSRERAAKVEAAGDVASENPPLINISSQSGAIVEMNVPLLKAAVLAPDDVMDVKLRIKILTNRSKLGSLSSSAIDLRQFVSGQKTDVDSNLISETKISSADADNFLTIPIPAAPLQEAIKNNGAARFELNLASGSEGELEIASHRPKISTFIPQLLVDVAHHPNVVLFDPPLQPKPGIFVRMKDGHFDYGGERLRLWGVTMNPRKNPEMADRIRKMGFNAVRLWGPPVVFDKDAVDGAAAVAQNGTGVKFDEYEKLFAAIEQQGMFIDCTALMDSDPVSIDDQSWLKPIGGDDWDSWRAAFAGKTKPDALLLGFGASFDERLFAARERHAKNFLQRVNPYTHKQYGEDEAVAFFELGNERSIIPRLAERGFAKWPDYFRVKLQKRWNAWLRARYKDDKALDTAWGKRSAGESLSDDTVQLAPLLAERLAYPHARGDDFIHFISDLTVSLNVELEKFARAQSSPDVGVAAVPFSFDTQFAPSTPWLFANAQGDIANFGTYVWPLTTALTAPPSLYVMDSSTVEGKASVIYETNVGASDPCRAEYPMRAAALASYQDWDAVFWHYFYGVTGPAPVPDEQYEVMPTKYMNANFYWTGVEFETDPVLLSSMGLAGQAFMRHLLAAASKPVTYVAGAKAIYGYDQFHGVSMGRSTFSTGSRIRFAPASDTGITVDGADPRSLHQRLEDAVASGDQILWDWPHSRLIIDSPGFKAYVGKPAGNYRFGDGLVVGDFKGDFVCFAMASANGEALLSDAAKRVYLTCVTDARNIGFQMDLKSLSKPDGILVDPTAQGRAIESAGHAPVIADDASFHLWWPRVIQATVASFDFALRKVDERSLNGNQFVWSGASSWMNVMSIQQQGSPVETPAMTAIAVAPSEKNATTETAGGDERAASALDIYNPLPDINWGDIYPHAHQRLRDGPLLMTRISPEVTSSNGDNSITLTDAEIAGTTATIQVKFTGGAMTSIDFTFGQAPELRDYVAGLEKELGPASVKKFAATADKTSTVQWRLHDKAADLNVDISEIQGVLTSQFQLIRNG